MNQLFIELWEDGAVFMIMRASLGDGGAAAVSWCRSTQAFDTLSQRRAVVDGGSEELIAYEVLYHGEIVTEGYLDVPGIQMQYPVLYENR